MIIPDIIGDIVSKVRAVYDPTGLKQPYYLYGHPAEIFGILSEKSQSETFKYDKYPLIALFMDYKEERDINFTIVKNATIVIMTETNKDFVAVDRYSNTFIPVLHPIYELFFKKLQDSKYLSGMETKYLHTKYDRLYWGKSDVFGNSGNIGNDALDAVVISDLNLKIFKC